MWPALAIAGASLISGFIGADATKSAAKTAAAGSAEAADATRDAAAIAAVTTQQGSRESIKAQQELFNLSRFDQAPWIAVGTGALAALTGRTAQQAFGDRTPPRLTDFTRLPSALNQNPQAVSQTVTAPPGAGAVSVLNPQGIIPPGVGNQAVERPQAAPPATTGSRQAPAGQYIQNGKVVDQRGTVIGKPQAGVNYPPFDPSRIPQPYQQPDTEDDGSGGLQGAYSGSEYDGPNITGFDVGKAATWDPTYAAYRGVTGQGGPQNPFQTGPSAAQVAASNPGTDYGSGVQEQVRGQNDIRPAGPDYAPNAGQRADLARDGGNAAAGYRMTADVGGGQQYGAPGGGGYGGGYGEPMDPTFAPSALNPVDPQGEFYNADVYQPGAEFSDPNTFRSSYTDPNQRQTAFDQNFRFDESALLQDPSYQFRLKQGLEALDAATRAGGIRRDGKGYKAFVDYAGDSASQEFGNAYGRQYSDYLRQQGLEGEVYQQNNADLVRRQQLEQTTDARNYADLTRRQDLEANTYNARQSERAARFNRLSALAGVGQVAANTVSSNASQLGAGVASSLTNASNALGAGAIATGQQLGNIAMGNANTQAQLGMAGAKSWNDAIQGGIANTTAYYNNQRDQAWLDGVLTRRTALNSGVTGTA